jgi:nucleoside 2-deoxyribosyltransferase
MRIYFAAALFSSRETVFNAALGNHLEQADHSLFLPQRDGFEFGNLFNTLKNSIPATHINGAMQTIIYLLDMGWELPRADAVVANLDEPLDDGVLVEISYAKLMGLPVIGFRTDARSPYGPSTDPLKGIHFFPAFQCDIYLAQTSERDEINDSDRLITNLAMEINSALASCPIPTKEQRNISKFQQIKDLIDASNLLFDGVEDIHSEQGIQSIVVKFLKHQAKFANLRPKIIPVSNTPSKIPSEM